MIVDVNAYLNPRSPNDRPRAQACSTALDQFAAYAAKERLRLVAILRGKELAEFPNASDFKGVNVRYAQSRDDFRAIWNSLCEGKKSIILVTSDGELDREAHTLGREVMGAAIFKKALFAILNIQAQPEPRRPQPPREKRREAPPPQPRKEEKDPILDLIDPL